MLLRGTLKGALSIIASRAGLLSADCCGRDWRPLIAVALDLLLYPALGLMVACVFLACQYARKLGGRSRRRLSDTD